MSIADEFQQMLNDIRSEYPPLLETDITREKLSQELGISCNAVRERMKKLINEGKYIEVIKRGSQGSKVATYQKVVK